eukprot:366281-Chlamydomonas_euryale.AAC.16
MRGLSLGLPLAAKMRATASASKAFAASPYTVSVGIATTPPARSMRPAEAIAAWSAAHRCSSCGEDVEATPPLSPLPAAVAAASAGCCGKDSGSTTTTSVAKTGWPAMAIPSSSMAPFWAVAHGSSCMACSCLVAHGSGCMAPLSAVAHGAGCMAAAAFGRACALMQVICAAVAGETLRASVPLLLARWETPDCLT